jgi:hypothetical protein
MPFDAPWSMKKPAKFLDFSVFWPIRTVKRPIVMVDIPPEMP